GTQLTKIAALPDGFGPTAFDVAGSPVDDSVVFKCRVRVTPGGGLKDDLCIVTRQGLRSEIFVDWPDMAPGTSRFLCPPQWDPSGEHVYFAMSYFSASDLAPAAPPNECGVSGFAGPYQRRELFKIESDGSGLTRLTNSARIFTCSPALPGSAGWRGQL